MLPHEVAMRLKGRVGCPPGPPGRAPGL